VKGQPEKKKKKGNRADHGSAEKVGREKKKLS
jgi:hypothetical protein